VKHVTISSSDPTAQITPNFFQLFFPKQSEDNEWNGETEVKESEQEALIAGEENPVKNNQLFTIFISTNHPSSPEEVISSLYFPDSTMEIISIERMTPENLLNVCQMSLDDAEEPATRCKPEVLLDEGTTVYEIQMKLN
jgi:hypothetical protein